MQQILQQNLHPTQLNMQTHNQSASLLTPIGYENSSCGYCKNKSGSISYYASTSTLTPEFYQALIDRGWRRSGKTLYKPDLRASCCPHYTIRLDSHAYHASKGQRQTQNRFNKFILGKDYEKKAARLQPKSREQAKKRNTDFDLLERVHESEKEVVKTPPQPEHEFTVTLEPDTFTEEKYVLFENYQRIVHHEPPRRVSRQGFRSFLCNSPLVRSNPTLDGRQRRVGSYHQCYRINGKLVAVGVLDLLPQCVSAVFFMYDESVHQHAFGRLGALREIALAKEEGYNWWYAGYYIHSCVKMRYKAEYAPQYMLDPVSYGWDLLTDEVKKKLDTHKFLSLSQEESPEAKPTLEIQTDSTIIDSMEGVDAPAGHKDEYQGDEEEADSDPDEPPILDPDVPIYSRPFVGVLTKAQLLAEVDLDHIKLKFRGLEIETYCLVGWDDSDIDSASSMKGAIAELAAAVGPDLAKEMVISEEFIGICDG